MELNEIVLNSFIPRLRGKHKQDNATSSSIPGDDRLKGQLLKIHHISRDSPDFMRPNNAKAEVHCGRIC